MIRALVLKEIQQHALAVGAALILVASALFSSWFIAFEENAITMLSSAQQIGLVGIPLLAIFVNGRFVVQDHQAGTHEFLSALPISPVVRTSVRLGLGWIVVVGTAMSVLMVTAALASRREGVPIGWLVQLAVQIALYTTAWHAVAFGIAHTGRYRWLVWWVLGVASGPLFALSDDPMRTFYWAGLLMDAADRTRLAPPWSAIPVTLAWTAGGVALSFAIATWRGGALLERWFQPVTADQRARLIAAGVAALLVSGFLSEQVPRADTWSALPAVPALRSTVRVAASADTPLWRAGTRVATELDAMAFEFGIPAWPPLVLLRDEGAPGEAPVRPARTQGYDVSRVLLVDVGRPTEELVRHILAEALAHRFDGLVDWDSDARWLAMGAAPWWLEDAEAMPTLAAMGIGAAASAQTDFHRTLADLGPDVGTAVAWAGLVALEREAGRDAVMALLGQVFAPERSTSWPSGSVLRWSTRPGWIERTTGVDAATWDQRWEAVLAEEGPLAVPPLPTLTIDERDGEVVARWEGAPPPGAHLAWVALHPLQTWPAPGDEVHVVEAPVAASEVQLPVDLRDGVVAQWVRYDEALGGRYTTGWGARR